MNYKQISRSTRADKLLFTANTIIHLVPEFNKNVYQLLFGSGIQLTNCSALVTKAQTVKLGRKTFNTKKLYLDTKSALTTDENKSKVVPVMRMLPKTIENNKFILIDHSILSKGTSYIQDMTSEKQTIFFLLNQIKNEFYNIKSKLPNIENVLMFLLGPEKPEKSIANLIERLPAHQSSELKMLFDKYMMLSVNVGGTHAKLFPIAGYKKDGNVEIYKQNISFMNKLLTLKPVKLKVEPSIETPINKDELKAISITTTKKVTEKVTDRGVVKLEVNEKELNQVLRRLNIGDKNIADNIKQSVDNYLKTKKDTIKELDLEKIILKAVNQTVFNTDKIDSQYLDNPSKLISKLIEVNTFQKKLTYPEPKTPHILSPKVIELNRVTGLVRQEYEFSKNIHTNIKTLFDSLETRKSNPIKIQKISHEYQDNNLDRVIKYNITLKNLAGGYKKPYDVSIKIPALVNDRYFKLNGKTYIIANQQFFVPITKTDPVECRLLTNFATMTLSVVNMKFNISELDKILDYMTRTYPDLIKNVEKNNNKITQVELTNDVIIDLYGQEAYISSTEILSYNIDTDKWIITTKDGTEQTLQCGKAEFIFEKILEILTSVNPDEKLQKSSRSIPYIQLYLGDVKVPLIVYLWQQLGLINALIKLGIDNNITTADKYQRQKNDFVVILEDDKMLVINPQNKREQLIVNGLTIANVNKLKLTSKNVNKQESIEDYITTKHGTRAVKNINHSTNNLIDPITLEILKFQDKSTNIVDIIGHDMVDKLLNEPEDALSDLKIYRSRQAEIMFELLYKALMIAHNTYKTEVDFGNEEAKAFLNNNYVIDCLLGVHAHTKGNSVLEIAEPYNPVAELKMASKLIKSGPGGISSRQAKKEHRNLHKSNQGNIGKCYLPPYVVMHIEKFCELLEHP